MKVDDGSLLFKPQEKQHPIIEKNIDLWHNIREHPLEIRSKLLCSTGTNSLSLFIGARPTHPIWTFLSPLFEEIVLLTVLKLSCVFFSDRNVGP